MKKIYFSLIYLFIVSGVIAQTTTIPDANFEQALIDAGIDKDFQVNGQVALIDIENITELNLYGKEIFDLTGIEDFKKLEFLDCSLNNFESLNLTQNIELRKLLCDDNSIYELDLSNNAKMVYVSIQPDPFSYTGVSQLNLNGAIDLETLYCNYNNGINLDVTNNPNLKYLHAHRTDLSNIDLSNNPKLIHLDLSGTSITKIDLNKNIDLEYIDISGGHEIHPEQFENGKLTSLDIDNNLKLTKVICNNNKLESLDVSNNIKLERLTCNNNLIKSIDFSNNGNLEFLTCGINPLIELDLSNNMILKTLNCPKSLLESLNVKNGTNAKLIGFDVTGNNSLTCIQVDNAIDANNGVEPYDTWHKDNIATYSEDCSALGVHDEILSSGLNLFPNPVTNLLSIDSKLPLEKVEIFNILGQKEMEIDSGFKSIRLSELTSGFYIIKIYSDKGTTVRKLIKQ